MSFWTRLTNAFARPTSVNDVDPVTIVNAYGAVLEGAPVVGVTVADTTELPYQKEAIKRALISLMMATNDTKMFEHLKAGYFMLAAWQPGVGPRRLGIDASKLDRNEDPHALAEKIGSEAHLAQKWLEASKVEEQTLLAELRAMGFWKDAHD